MHCWNFVKIKNANTAAHLQFYCLYYGMKIISCKFFLQKLIVVNYMREMLYQSNRKSLLRYLDFDAFQNMASWLRKKLVCSEISLWFYHEHSRTTKREVIFKLSKDAFRNTHVFHGHCLLDTPSCYSL